jgi:hypothetical protein
MSELATCVTIPDLVKLHEMQDMQEALSEEQTASLQK